ncbi:MAG: Arc family DNA-binding protein [Cyclobacteriaceae bacterium]|nr:Arc family DNA-binding protein [Cyclobacteriaceae bacterium]MDX5466453.1 Arc family DNA-binding protein [Cyclobacteriaceae bacterium]
MARKKAFALRLDEDMLKAVEKWAADEFRSSNGQLEWIIREALKKSGRLPKGNSSEENETI